MPPQERARLRAEGYAHLHAAGAHEVIDGIGELPLVIERIEARARLARAA